MKTLRDVSRVVFICLLMSFYAPATHAQALTSLRGVVSDMTGAAIPHARVTLTNEETGLKRSVETHSDGSYAFFGVPPGTYLIQSTAPGFQTVNVKDIRLVVDTPATLNIPFQRVGAVSETVSVVGSEAPVSTTNSSLGNAIGALPILQLPLDSRNVVGLLELQPGVTTQGAVNGGKTDQGNITLDGVDVNEQQNRTAFTSVLRTPLDSVQEFRVTTLNAPADEGRTSGAQVVLETKSGTNAIHGSAYEFNRNTSLAANNYFNNRIGLALPRLNRNLFGGSLGGPAIKSKLFYFFNFETTIDRSQGVGGGNVPMDHMRQGSLWYRQTDGTIAELSPSQVTSMVDPAHIGPDPAILQVWNKFPEPNNPFGGDGVNTLGYSFIGPLPGHLRTYVSRIDYLPGSGKHALFFRGTLDNDRSPGTATNPALGLPTFPGQSPGTLFLNNSKGLAAGDTMILKSNLTNILRYGLTREGAENTGSIRPGTTQIMATSTANNADPASLYAQTTDLSRIIPTHTISDDVNWVKGSHSIQFGGVFRAIRNRSINSSYLNYGYQDVSWLGADPTGTEFVQNLPNIDPNFAKARQFPETAVQMLGLVTLGNSNVLYDKNGNPLPPGTPKNRTFVANEFEFYGQDSWRATRGLTVTAGLRWSLFPPIHEANGYQSELVPTASAWLDQRQALALAGQSQAQAGLLQYQQGGELYQSHNKNFSPRLSFAYSPQFSGGWLGKLVGGPGNTVIRAGAGVFYDLYGENLMLTADQSNLGYAASQFGSAGVYNGATAPRIQTWGVIPAGVLLPPPQGGFPYTPPLSSPGAFSANAGIDKNLKPPYSLDLNFSLGRQLPAGIFLEASYAGKFSHRSLINLDVAEPLNLIDHKSGQSFFQASQQIEKLVTKNTPLSQVPNIPFWQDLWPGAAGNGLSATQGVYQVFQANAPDWGDGALFTLDDICQPSCSALGPFALVNQQYQTLATWTSTGYGNYNALEVTARKRFQNGILFDVNYTFSKCLDLSSGGEDPQNGAHGVAALVYNTSDPHQSYGRCDYDYPHLVNANWVWQLPFGKGQKFLGGSNKLLDSLIGGWQLSGIFQYRRGWESLVASGNWTTNLWWETPPMGSAVPRTQVGQNITGLDGRSGPGIFSDPASVLSLYRVAYTGESGNTRNSIATPPYTNFDMGFGKRFIMPYNESHSIQLRVEAFNVFNTTHFGPASLDIDNPSTFGKITTALNPRVVQLSGRYEF